MRSDTPLLWKPQIQRCLGSYESNRLLAAMRAQRRWIGVNESGLDEEGLNAESVTICRVIERTVVADVRMAMPAGLSMSQHDLVPLGGLSREPGCR